MSSTNFNELSSFSRALTRLVKEAASGVVAVKSGAYRTSSGIRLRDDLIAVASHSLRREQRVTVQTADGNETQAAVLGRDAGLDVAILKADGIGGSTITPADPAAFETGALAVVVGLTADVGPTASLGVLGAVGLARKMWRGGSVDNFLRLDVNLYPSQSGAAVLTAEGRLIGMATPALSRYSTIAIPTATLERLTRELLEQGRIRRGYLGIGVQPVSLPETLRSALPEAKNRGLMLLSVEPESPAEKAGLQLGDILVLFNGSAMSDIDDLQEMLRGEVVGQSARAVVLRAGKPVEAHVTVRERNAQEQ